MNFYNFLFLFLFRTSLAHEDRPCGENFSELWLDIVILVDNSEAMGKEGLERVQENIVELFEDVRIGTSKSQPKTTRIGLVTYSRSPVVKANLNSLQSLEDLERAVANLTLSDTWDSYLAMGLEAAEEVFYAGTLKSNRTHFQKALIVYSSIFNPKFDPISVAERLQSDGVTIITVNSEFDVDKELDWDLSKVATPRFNFTIFENDNLLDNVRGALLQANCFCPNEWLQYRSSYIDEYSVPYGTCLNYLPLTASWTAARFACRNIHKNAFLVSEYDKNKHDYVREFVRNSEGPNSYHIGLNFVKGVWQWDQPPGWPQPKLEGFENWDSGFPMTSSSRQAVFNVLQGYNSSWQNIPAMSASAGYVCEVAACDTDNYCDFDDVN